MRAFAAEYSSVVAKVAASHQGTVRTLADTAADLGPAPPVHSRRAAPHAPRSPPGRPELHAAPRPARCPRETLRRAVCSDRAGSPPFTERRQLGPAFGLLSQTETELSLPFTQMADTLGSLRELLLPDRELLEDSPVWER